MRRINVGRLMSEVVMDGNAHGTPGAQLAAARTALGWTVEQVAEQLKLAPRQVQALEACDYKALPGLATVRGFVRAYAKLVKLDAAALVAMIGDRDVPVSTLPPVRRDLAMPFSEVRLPSMRRRGLTAANGWILGAVLLVVVVAVAAKMGWLKPLSADFLKRDPVSASAAASAAASAPAAPGVENTSATAVTPILGPVPAMPAANMNTPTPVPLVANPPIATVAATPVANTGNSLVLKFSQKCWVRVKRMNGEIRLDREMSAGETTSIEITDPVRLELGNNAGVEATLRGTPLNVKNDRTNITRMTIE
jgi:cytoskeleton protein RodZ